MRGGTPRPSRASATSSSSMRTVAALQLRTSAAQSVQVNPHSRAQLPDRAAAPARCARSTVPRGLRRVTSATPTRVSVRRPSLSYLSQARRSHTPRGSSMSAGPATRFRSRSTARASRRATRRPTARTSGRVAGCDEASISWWSPLPVQPIRRRLAHVENSENLGRAHRRWRGHERSGQVLGTRTNWPQAVRAGARRSDADSGPRRPYTSPPAYSAQRSRPMARFRRT